MSKTVADILPLRRRLPDPAKTAPVTYRQAATRLLIDHPLTEEDVDRLPAGPELDFLLCYYVLRLRPWFSDGYLNVNEELAYLEPAGNRYHPKTGHCYICKPYRSSFSRRHVMYSPEQFAPSTSQADALALLERAWPGRAEDGIRRGWRLERFGPERTGSALVPVGYGLDVFTGVPEHTTWVAVGEASTLPLAVARALLRYALTLPAPERPAWLEWDLPAYVRQENDRFRARHKPRPRKAAQA